MAKPLGGPKVELSEPTHLLGAFVSRANRALLIVGSLLTVGGVAGAGAAIYDLSTGRASFGDVMKDIAIFVEGWFVELIAPTYDAELEKTHAYALGLLILPGLVILWFNLIPVFKRGNEFQIHPDGSVSFRGFSREYEVRLRARSVPSSSADSSPAAASRSRAPRAATASPHVENNRRQYRGGHGHLLGTNGRLPGRAPQDWRRGHGDDR